MPVGYLLPAALVAWCVLCALAPRALPGAVGFFCGFLVNELPCVAVYALLAVTASTVAQGGIGSPVGLVALGLSVLAVAGLVVVARRATRAGPIVDSALIDGLGPGWPAEIDAPLAAGLRPGFRFGAATLRPAFARRRDVRRVADIGYGEHGAANRLDVYRHRSDPTGCPVLIHLHGGRLERGRKNREGLPLIYRLASRGWVCVSANYRLAPAATFPDHLIDVKKIIAWVRAEGPRFGADPAVVFIAGGSSGAQLAALAALTANDERYQPGFEDADTSVAGAVCLYGLYDERAGIDAAPRSHLRAEAPPFFLAHGDRDTVLPASGARAFATALRAVSRRPVVYAELPGAQHTFDMFHSVRCDNIVNAIESFTAWVRANPAPDVPRI